MTHKITPKSALQAIINRDHPLPLYCLACGVEYSWLNTVGDMRIPLDAVETAAWREDSAHGRPLVARCETPQCAGGFIDIFPMTAKPDEEAALTLTVVHCCDAAGNSGWIYVGRLWSIDRPSAFQKLTDSDDRPFPPLNYSLASPVPDVNRAIDVTPKAEPDKILSDTAVIERLAGESQTISDSANEVLADDE